MTESYSTTNDSINQRLEAINTLFEKYHQSLLQNSTRTDHSPAAVKNVLPKMQHASDTLKMFLNNFLNEETRPDCEESISTYDADNELKALLTKMCPLLLPWHPHLSTLVHYMIVGRFEENNPFLPNQVAPTVHENETLGPVAENLP